MKGKLIFVIDDDPDIQSLLTAFLVHEGCIVRNGHSAAEALALLAVEEPDLILLDIQMPDMDGITLCENIRNDYKRPILFVTGTQQEQDKAKSLQSGGDDYITKPFDPVDVMLRVQANLRWGSLLDHKETNDHLLEFPGIHIDLRRMAVTVNDVPVRLLAKDYQILITLAKQPNQVFHPKQLYQQVWENDFNYSKDTIKVHISNLRKKIEPDPARPRYIITVSSLGYRFNPYGAV